MSGDAAARRVALKRRALLWLAQREHSRAELRRKLLAIRHTARAPGPGDPGAKALADVPPDDMDDPAVAREALLTLVDQILDELSADGWLCDARVAESRLLLRSARFGARRIESELHRLGVSATPQALADLRASEVDRARAVWLKKYGGAALDAPGRARQMRFLAGRGFSTDAIRRVVPGANAPDDAGEDTEPALSRRAAMRPTPPAGSDA